MNPHYLIIAGVQVYQDHLRCQFFVHFTCSPHVHSFVKFLLCPHDIQTCYKVLQYEIYQIILCRCVKHNVIRES